MKTLGIIGGIAPESTIEYYRSIVALYRSKLASDPALRGQPSYPPVIINSIDMTAMLDLVGAGNLAGLTDYLLRELRKLKNAGADWGLLASNTPHIVFEDLAARSPMPLISIVEATCAAVKKLQLDQVALFGTRFTMQGKFYPEVFTKAGIALIAPDSEDQEYIHAKYMGELVNGVYLDETRTHMLAIVDRMKATSGIQGLILGGTELPLLLRDPAGRGIPFLDTTQIHVASAVARMMS